MIARLRAEWDAWIIGLAVFLFHLRHVPAVAAAPIFHKSNLAFDFDIDRFTQLWGLAPFPVDQNETYYAVRHPLAVLVRLVCRPLVAAGLDAHIAACSIAALCAALSSVLVFKIARELGVQRTLAHILTALWALSASSLVLGVLPESYDLALVTLSWQFLLAVRWIQGSEPARVTRIAAGVANFGITITNVVLSGLSELACRLARQPVQRAVMGAAGFSAAVAAIGLALSVASFLVWPVQGVDSSTRAAKQLYWDAASAERTTERQSVGDVAWTFGATAFVAPPPARYASGVPGNPYLWDIRGQHYTPLGWAAVAGWLGLMLFGAVAAARDRTLRPVWITAALWMAGNIGLHSYWQFRDAVFLYAGHSHIAFFLLVLAGARWAQGRRPGTALAYTGAAGLVALLAALNNLPLYLALSRLD